MEARFSKSASLTTSVWIFDLATVEEKSIRLVAGLGNPGPEYTATRHNVGFMVVDQLAAQFGSTWERLTKWDAFSAKCGNVFVVKPMSFMNRSGHPLFAVAQFYKITAGEILVVLDDLALPLGRLRLRLSGGSGCQNGLEWLFMAVGTEKNPALRHGVWERPREREVAYVPKPSLECE